MMMAVTPASAWAVQILDADEDVSLAARISNHDPNRIRIAGGFITMAVGPQNGRITIETDDKQGQIFVRLNAAAQETERNKAFTLFLTDAKGIGYTLLLKPADISGESLIIRPRPGSAAARRPVGITAREERLKHLVRAMAMDDIPHRCTFTEESRRAPLWQGTDFRMERSMQCGDFSVERYRLTNTNDTEIHLAEQELYGDDIAAVSVERMHLNHAGVISLDPGSSTMVIIVREFHHG
jgi:conjugal transfer pilus assembly protein TraK